MTTPTLGVEIPNPEASSTVTPAVNGAGSSRPDSRCQHRYLNGTRCRLRALQSPSGLCSRHDRLKAAGLSSAPDDSADLSPELLHELSEFSSAADVREFLARLLVQLTKGRVSPRRASVLAFITNQLLHSHRAVLEEQNSQPRQFIFDLPRPKLD